MIKKKPGSILSVFLINIIRENKGTIVDVRTPSEYNKDHIDGSVNIPIKEIFENPGRISELKSPVVLCCKSGERSREAYFFLQCRGINCYNGGPYKEVKFHLGFHL
jgi:phage shock protein E